MVAAKLLGKEAPTTDPSVPASLPERLATTSLLGQVAPLEGRGRK